MAETDLSRLKLARGDDGMLTGTRGLRWRRTVTVVLAGGLILVGGGWALERLRNAPVAVEQATVTTAFPYQSFAVLTSTGYVVAQRKASVASKATGRLEWLGVAEGSRVRAGEVIARLESDDVRAARAQAEAGLKVALANLEQARVELADARRNLKRSTELLARNFVSQSVHDEAAARVDKAAAAARSLEASVGVARASLRSAEISVEQTLIRAPFDGVVLTKSANVGDVVTPFSSALDTKGAVVTMADMSTLEVEADVSESNLSRVHAGQPVEIQLDALPDRRFQGVVSRMVPTVDRAKATVTTKVRFLKIDPEVLPEMSAKVTFLSQEVTPDQREARTAVAAGAVVQRDGNPVVYVIDDGAARVTPVRAGARIGDLVEIASGLSPGQKVVLKPGAEFRDGTRVKAIVR